jgi:hypothetical protein
MNNFDPHSTTGAAVLVMLGLAKYFHIDMDATFAVSAVMLVTPVVRWLTTRANAEFPAPKAPVEAPKAA